MTPPGARRNRREDEGKRGRLDADACVWRVRPVGPDRAGDRARTGPGADPPAARPGREATSVARAPVRVDRGPLDAAGWPLGLGRRTLGGGPGRMDPGTLPADRAGLDLRGGSLEALTAGWRAPVRTAGWPPAVPS